MIGELEASAPPIPRPLACLFLLCSGQPDYGAKVDGRSLKRAAKQGAAVRLNNRRGIRGSGILRFSPLESVKPAKEPSFPSPLGARSGWHIGDARRCASGNWHHHRHHLGRSDLIFSPP